MHKPLLLAGTPCVNFILRLQPGDEQAVLAFLAPFDRSDITYDWRVVGWTHMRRLVYWQVAFVDACVASDFVGKFHQYFVATDAFTVVTVDGNSRNSIGSDAATAACATALPLCDELELWCAQHCAGSEYFVKAEVTFTPDDPVHVIYHVGFSDRSVAMLCKLTYG
jgi:hypothetical protein